MIWSTSYTDLTLQRAWLLLALIAFSLFGIALGFQYILLLNPCVFCIYQRLAVLLLGLSLSIGAFSRHPLARLLGLLGWIASSIWGFYLAWKLNDIEQNPSPFATCDYLPNFPSWMPLEQWLPSMFMPTGQCGQDIWQFLQLTMTQWMLIIFSGYALLAVIFVIQQGKVYAKAKS